MPRADIKILGGLPVTIDYRLARAEPDVGIFEDYVDEWEITHINDRKVKKCSWLYKRINSSKNEEERILTTLAQK